MINGGHGQDDVKIIRRAIKILDRVGQNAGLRQLKLLRHGAECLMTSAGIVCAFGEGLESDDMARAMHRGPETEHAFAAADLHHGLIAEIDVTEDLAGESRKIVAMVPHTHFLTHDADALGEGGLADWSTLM